MGKGEELARKRRSGSVERAVLGALGAAGVLAIALVAPNALKLLPRKIRDPYKFKNYTNGTLTKLARAGYVVFEERGGKKYARLTPLGERQLGYERMTRLDGQTPSRWDKKWRLVLFDVPEKRRAVRNRLRAVMAEAGFLRLQDSAWIHPYDCEDLIALLKADLHIGRDVLYLIVEYIENDAPIRRHFGLPA